MIHARTQPIEIEAAAETAGQMAGFARRLEAIRLGRQASAGADAKEQDAAGQVAGPQDLGRG